MDSNGSWTYDIHIFSAKFRHLFYRRGHFSNRCYFDPFLLSLRWANLYCSRLSFHRFRTLTSSRALSFSLLTFRLYRYSRRLAKWTKGEIRSPGILGKVSQNAKVKGKKGTGVFNPPPSFPLALNVYDGEKSVRRFCSCSRLAIPHCKQTDSV